MSCNKKVLIPYITPRLKSPLPSIHVFTSAMGGRDAQASLTNYFRCMWGKSRHGITLVCWIYDSCVRQCGALWKVTLNVMFLGWRFQWDTFCSSLQCLRL